MKRIFIIVALCTASLVFTQCKNTTNESETKECCTTDTKTTEKVELKHGSHREGKRTDADMAQWRQSGLGQFIHWGVYAIPGGEWNGKKTTYAAEWFRSSGLITKEEYDNLYKEFNPTKYNATQWAKQAKDMGAKYLIFTTKHHDGFCLWPSKYTDYTIENTPYKNDIVGEVVEAYTKEGIDVHLYFSIIDWNHPGYLENDLAATSAETREMMKEGTFTEYDAFQGDTAKRAKYEEFKEFTRNQLLELLTNYPTIKGLWFDGSWDVAWMRNASWVDSLGMELREKHPGLIIGSRFRSDELGARHIDTNGDLIDDYNQTFERNLPNTLAETKGQDWDCVMTIPENQWGFHRDWTLSYVKTPYELIEMMVKANSLDGNFVINFGPDGLGNIRSEETYIASEVGKWMKINNEAIYGVEHSNLEKQAWGYYTQKGDDTYAIVFNKPLNNKIRIKAPRAKESGKIVVIESAQYLAGKTKAEVKFGGRDKGGNHYYDVIVPANLQTTGSPFVIKMSLKEVSKDGEEYMQAII